MFILVLTCELNANGNTFTFCDHVSYCESKTVRRIVFNWRLLFSTSPLDHSAFGVRGLNCTLYIRQKCQNSPLLCSFSLSVSDQITQCAHLLHPFLENGEERHSL